MAYSFTGSYFTIRNSSGVPLSNAKIFFYAEGSTTTLLPVYLDSELSILSRNPVRTDAVGRFKPRYLPNNKYRVIVQDADGNEISDQDDFQISTLSPVSNGLETSGTNTFATIKTNLQTGTSYTVQDSDRAKLISYNNASSVAVTLPQPNETTFVNKWFSYHENRGAGDVTITPTSSTLNSDSDVILPKDTGVMVTSDGTNYSALYNFMEVAGSLRKLSTVTASSSSTVDFTSGIDSTYRQYMIIGSNIKPSNDGEPLRMQVSSDGLSTVLNFAYHNAELTSTGSTYGANLSSSADNMRLSSTGWGSDTVENGSFVITLDNPSSSSDNMIVKGMSTFLNINGVPIGNVISASILATNAVDSIRFKYTSGTITSGTFSLYTII